MMLAVETWLQNVLKEREENEPSGDARRNKPIIGSAYPTTQNAGRISYLACFGKSYVAQFQVLSSILT